MNRHRARWLATVGALAALSGCGAGLGLGASGTEGSPVPVVTSVVGAAGASLSGGPGSPGGASGTTRAGAGTPGSRATTTVAARGYGEPEHPMTVPPTTASVVGPEASAVGDAARAFLAVYWAGGSRTWGQLADQLAPFATDAFLAGYREPARAGKAAPPTAVTDQSVEVTTAADTTATAVGRGTSTEADRRVSVWRTLELVRDEAGAWKVNALR